MPPNSRPVQVSRAIRMALVECGLRCLIPGRDADKYYLTTQVGAAECPQVLSSGY